MFEFGRDLRKLFDKARESEDLGWVELIGVDLLHAEARRESIDAGGTELPLDERRLTRARRAVEKAIRGMLPKNSLGRQQLSKLKVYVGAEHPHAAQQPTPYTFDQVAQ